MHANTAGLVALAACLLVSCIPGDREASKRMDAADVEASVAYFDSDMTDAEQGLLKQIEIAEKLNKTNPDAYRYDLVLSHAYARLGDIEVLKGNTNAAVDYLDRALYHFKLDAKKFNISGPPVDRESMIELIEYLNAPHTVVWREEWIRKMEKVRSGTNRVEKRVGTGSDR